jgi:O-antigen/teichoic acid export membrane protein
MLPFVFAGGMQILNKETSVVLLGVLQEAEAAGLFRVAQRGAELITFGLIAVNMAIAPTLSELFTKGEKQRLQSLISKSVLAIMLFAVPMALCLILGGTKLISLVFGKEYASAYMPMAILCLGHLVNAGMGSVGIILNMAGLEHITARGVAISTLINVALNILLIPFLSSLGAAIATSSSLVIWNVLLSIWLYKKTGIVSTLRFAH